MYIKIQNLKVRNNLNEMTQYFHSSACRTLFKTSKACSNFLRFFKVPKKKYELEKYKTTTDVSLTRQLSRNLISVRRVSDVGVLQQVGHGLQVQAGVAVIGYGGNFPEDPGSGQAELL